MTGNPAADLDDLDDLRWHYGEAYLIDLLGGRWVAQRRDSHATMSAEGPDQLFGLIRSDYLAHPVARPATLPIGARGRVTSARSGPAVTGGFGLPGAMAVPRDAEEMFRRWSHALPAESRRLLLLAAAEPTGDPILLWRAAGRLGLRASAAQPAADAGLAEFGARVRFRHPLVRSAAYPSASAQERQQVHAALAEATDPVLDPDRRAWHRAQAALDARRTGHVH